MFDDLPAYGLFRRHAEALALALFLAALFALRSEKPRLKALAPFCLAALIWGDMLTSGPRPNPTAPRWIYEPGLAAREVRMNPLPRVGDGRPMLHAEAAGNMAIVELTNATDTVLYHRLAMSGNLNLLDNVPKATGFYSLFFRELGEILTMLYATPEPPAGLLDFLSIAQMNAPVASAVGDGRAKTCLRRCPDDVAGARGERI